MPRTKIGVSPFEENERILIANIKYEIGADCKERAGRMRDQWTQ